MKKRCLANGYWLIVRGFTQEGSGWWSDGGILTPPANGGAALVPGVDFVHVDVGPFHVQFADAVLAQVPINDDPLDGPVHTNEYFHFWAAEVRRSQFAQVRWVNGRRETIVIYDHDA